MLLVDIVKLNIRPQDRRASLRHNPHTCGGTIPTMTTAIVVIISTLRMCITSLSWQKIREGFKSKTPSRLFCCVGLQLFARTDVAELLMGREERP